MAAPWEDDPEGDAAERKEANRAALKKALRNKRQQRSSKAALSHADEESAATGVSAQEMLSSTRIDAKMIQTLMRKSGQATDNAPSARKLKRLMAAMPPGYLAAMAASGGAAAGLGV